MTTCTKIPAYAKIWVDTMKNTGWRNHDVIKSFVQKTTPKYVAVTRGFILMVESVLSIDPPKIFMTIHRNSSIFVAWVHVLYRVPKKRLGKMVRRMIRVVMSNVGENKVKTFDLQKIITKPSYEEYIERMKDEQEYDDVMYDHQMDHYYMEFEDMEGKLPVNFRHWNLLE
jgi:hypothetical protein